MADASKGISILGNIDGLNINIGELLNLVNAYVPTIEYAGVKSDNGFTVRLIKSNRMIRILVVLVALLVMAVEFKLVIVM